MTNKKGYPVLLRPMQALVRKFIPLDVQVIIEGRSRGHDMSHFQNYIDHLWQQQETKDPLKQYAKGFEDFLQSPLQPLMDNLESSTYEVFEKDPVKYTEYERAMYKAILDKLPEEKKDQKLILMVLGAGRGKSLFNYYIIEDLRYLNDITHTSPESLFCYCHNIQQIN